jgi:hypothetical protein
MPLKNMAQAQEERNREISSGNPVSSKSNPGPFNWQRFEKKINPEARSSMMFLLNPWKSIHLYGWRATKYGEGIANN